MNAQDKAKELVEKFLNAEFNCKECNMPFCDIPCTNLALFEAKQCAIIAVDGILKANAVWVENSIPYKYWNEVKKEIERL